MNKKSSDPSRSDLEEMLNLYLERTPELYRKEIKRFWDLLKLRNPDIEYPGIIPTYEGSKNYEMFWSEKHRFYLGVTFYPDGSLFWFYRDRKSGYSFGDDVSNIDNIPEWVIDKLLKFKMKSDDYE